MDFLQLLLRPSWEQMSVGWFGDFWQMLMPPEDISTSGHLITYLFNYTTYLNVFYFLLVCIGIFGFSYLYHHKRHPIPYFTYGNKKNHLLVTAGIGLAVFLSIDLNITRLSNNDMINTFWNWPKFSEERDEAGNLTTDVVRVEVLGQQWMWHFRYPGKDGVFNTLDDIVSSGEMVVPANKKILVHLTSKDVIHSLYLPNAKVKIDAIPGRITRMWFELNKPGNYEIACAEMCGIHHYLMKAKLTVYSESDFLAWENEANTIALAANDINNRDTFWGWNWESGE